MGAGGQPRLVPGSGGRGRSWLEDQGGRGGGFVGSVAAWPLVRFTLCLSHSWLPQPLKLSRIIYTACFVLALYPKGDGVPSQRREDRQRRRFDYQLGRRGRFNARYPMTSVDRVSNCSLAPRGSRSRSRSADNRGAITLLARSAGRGGATGQRASLLVFSPSAPERPSENNHKQWLA